MNQANKKVKLANYETCKPQVSYSGREAEATVFMEDATLTLYVNLELDGLRDEIYIESIEAEMFDEEDRIISTSNLDLESLVIDIFEKYNTFGQAERAMAQAYKDMHD